MNEAAVEKLDTLITESQPQAEAPKLFKLDQPDGEVIFEVIYSQDDRVVLSHRIKWPTLDKLIARQRKTPQKARILGSRRTRVQGHDGVEADAWLWDQFKIGRAHV